MSIYSPAGIKVNPYSYEQFMGIDTSRDQGSMDTGTKQHLTQLINGYCDWRGMIVKDPDLTKRPNTDGVISHINFFGSDLITFSVRQGGGTSLMSDKNHIANEIYSKTAVVSSTVFNKKNIYFSAGEDMRIYNGVAWTKSKSPSSPKAGFGVAIQSRLAVAGIPGQETLVDISRVDDESVFSGDEDDNAIQVTKGAFIDVRNMIGSAEKIKGLGTFEQDKLAIFLEEQTLLYTLSPSISNWQIVPNTNIRVGCISHNTIAQAGTDLMFCSRSGVYSVRRSAQNGISIYQQPFSYKIEELYRELVKRTPVKEEISAFYDPEMNQYHIFFPITDMLSTRLTLTFSPIGDDEPKWSVGEFLNQRCGAQMGGITLFGTSGGVYQQGYLTDELELSPPLIAKTPILWHGSMNETKQSYSFVLQAVGTGTVYVEARDEKGNLLQNLPLEIKSEQNDGTFYDVPLPDQYERKFEHSYRGVQFTFTTSPELKGSVKIIGFAVLIRSK